MKMERAMEKQWYDTLEQAKHFRRELHRHPELSWEEKATAERIRKYLTDNDISWRPCADTGTVARFNGAASGQHIALRGDIDALPIVEQSNRPWKSLKEGCMHACGHDGHTATLMATAVWLNAHEKQLKGPVSLLFQPAEEGGHGAKAMIEDGALDGVDVIYGWHNWPAIPYGKLVCPDSIVMCGNGTFEINLKGRGGHASQPELCRDPVLAAAAITLNLQQAVSRRIAPQKPAVLSITSIEAPSGATTIPDHAHIGGSIRVPERQTKEHINTLIRDISEATARAYGVECEVHIHPRYEATINHPSAAKQVRDCWLADGGAESLDNNILLPVMASEDFSYYLEKIPGAYALIGADDGENHHYPCHSAYYDFNDKLIEKVLRLYSRLVGLPVISDCQ